MFSIAQGEDDPITKLKDDTMLYFKPVKGIITGVEGNKVIIKIDEKDSVRQGMRLKVLREGAPFVHPVTKEFLGKIEATIGKVEITELQPEPYTGIIIEGEAIEGDKVRISETKVKMFFCQDKNIDWYLADEYYRKLKGTGRIEMIDSALETCDESKGLEEAKRLGADVALLLTAKEAEKGTLIREKLLWVSDGSKFIDMEINVDTAFAKELKFGEEFFTPEAGEALLMYDLPFGARHVATGDLDGNGKQEIILSTGNDTKVYSPAADLQFLWEIEGPATDDHIWIDTFDLNRNGKDEIIITSIRQGNVTSGTDSAVVTFEDSEVVSYIYELEGSEFKKLWEGKYFLHRIGNSLVVQSFSNQEGFSGDIFDMTWNGGYKIGMKIKVPKGVNIYDFVYIEGEENERLIFAYDEKGFLNLYNENGIRTWRSNSGTGGFVTIFKKQTPAVHIDRGEWYVKDRLISRHREVLVVERIPILEMAIGLGYKNSRIKNYWWNGISMEEGVLINDIKGSVLDYTLTGDNIVVLASPFLGIKFKNILQGENPLGKLLYLYSIKGR
jgi:hypothetical protein